MIKKAIFWGVRKLGSSWHVLLSIFIILGSILILFAMDQNWNKASDIGTYLSGFTSALAFLWLIKGFQAQSAELGLQRQELALQRDALNSQSSEMRSASKFSTLTQVDAILNRACNKVIGNGFNIDHVAELSSVHVRNMNQAQILMTSTDAQSVSHVFNGWSSLNSLITGFLAEFAWAMKIYLEHYLRLPFDEDLSDAVFICGYAEKVKTALFFREHVHTVQFLAELVKNDERKIQSYKLAGVAATALLHRSDVNMTAVYNVIAEVRLLNAEMPEIVETI